MLSRISALIFSLLAISLSSVAWSDARDENTLEPSFTLHVTEQLISTACRERLSTLVNGTIPGPTLYLKEDQSTWVRVYNDMTGRNLTMHWHGLSQRDTPGSDGASQASQWPIEAGQFFDYKLKPSVGEAGTYLYYSDVGFQASTATGALVVEEKDQSPPFSYDYDKVLFLSELWNKTDSQVEEGLLVKGAGLQWPGEAASVLLNGKGYRGLDANQTGTVPPWGKPNSSAEKSCGPEIIEVEPDTTYRLRFISGASLSPLAVAIEDHSNLTIIAADGSYTHPAETDLIQISPGQRYDVLLHTKSNDEIKSSGSQYWIQIETRYRNQNNTFYGILSYDSSRTVDTEVPPEPPSQKPVDIPYALHDWMEYTLKPLRSNSFPSAKEVSRQVYLTTVQRNSSAGQLLWVMNNQTWTENNQHRNNEPYYNVNSVAGSPYLLDIYKHGEKAIPDFDMALSNDGRDIMLNAYPARVGEVIDIIFLNEVSGLDAGFDAHSFHIHGGHAYDLGSGRGSYDSVENERRLEGYNPIMRDTSLLYKYVNGDGTGTGHDHTIQGWRAWRLRVDNPGMDDPMQYAPA